MAIKRMYSRSLQDVAQSIIRVKGVRKVIYLHVADVSCTRGIRESTGEAPAVGFRDTTPPLIGAELWRRYSYYIYIKGTFKV